jgi:NADPH:quinone reductase-like Zn-dependent oxidoreductase
MDQNMMKAVKCSKYGPPEVLKLVEVERPVPKEDEILIEIKAAAVSSSILRGLKPVSQAI